MVPPLGRRVLVELEPVVVLRRELRLVADELELFRRSACPALLPPRRIPLSARLENALNEPPDVSHPIFKRENCLTAPHVIGVSRGAMRRVFTSMANDMAAVLKGEKPRYVVNPEVLP